MSTHTPPSPSERLQIHLARLLLRLPVRATRRWVGPPPEIDQQRLDPQVHWMMRLQRYSGAPMHTMTPQQARRHTWLTARITDPPAQPMAAVLQEVLHTEHGDLGLRLYRPSTAPPKAPALVYYHGGGYVIGDLDTHDAACRLLAHHSGCVVAAVDYRLAPEHPCPAAAQDALAAFLEIHRRAADWSLDPERIAVGGDSAGGNLAAVACQQARDAGLPQPHFQLLIYPATDRTPHQRPSTQLFAQGQVLTAQLLRWFSRHYLKGSGVRSSDPRVSPLLHPDLSGLPPALLVIAGFDVLRDEGLAYAEALQAAGTPAQVHLHPSLFHGFVQTLGVVDEGLRAWEQAAAALREAMR